MRRSRQTRATWAAPGQPRCSTTSELTMIRRVSMRPCAFSSVSARVMSGGSTAGPPPASQGGKIAEALGDGGFQLGLVVFDREQVIAIPVRDRSTDLALAE